MMHGHSSIKYPMANETKLLFVTSTTSITNSSYCYDNSTSVIRVPILTIITIIQLTLFLLQTPLMSSKHLRNKREKFNTHYTDSQQVTSFSLCADALLRSPGNVGQPLERALQTSAIRPGGVEILVVSVLLKFLHNKHTGKHMLGGAIL